MPSLKVNKTWLLSLAGGIIGVGGLVAGTTPETSASEPRKAPTRAKLIPPAADADTQSALELTFGEHATDKIDMQLSGREVVARDDGRNGDRQAGDGVYTTRVDNELAQRFERLASATETSGERFDGRTMQKRLTDLTERCSSAPLPLTDLSSQEEQRLIDQALMIIDTSVVDSPEAQSGSWSFGHLMTELANQETTGIAPADFTERWLKLWLNDQPVNPKSARAVAVPKRESLEALVLDPWREASGSAILDLKKAPLRLLAIVFRLDLRSNVVIGPTPRIGGGGAGELRFVYCLVDRQQQQQPFTVIFEYEVQRENFAGVLAWAQDVYSLYRNYDHIDGDDYRAALKRLTTSVTERGANPEQVPNGSHLGQIRTNENALSRTWELREFRIDTGNTGYLTETTVKQTPDLRFNGQSRLTDFIRKHETELLCEMHVIPVERDRVAFLASSALNPSGDTTPTEATFFWNAPDLTPQLLEARHKLSLATCNGCHGGETKTSGLLHVSPRDVGERSTLSGFLTGIVVPDPAGQLEEGRLKNREFNDLSRRARDLKALVDHQDAYEITRPVLQMVH